ncbi:hypothetical protein [Alsobacter soli]|nr:hypothetical protein [Alsobacter soli]
MPDETAVALAEALRHTFEPITLEPLPVEIQKLLDAMQAMEQADDERGA